MRTLLIGVFFIGFVAVLLFLRKPAPITPKPEPDHTPIVSLAPSPPSDSLDLDNNGKSYRTMWLTIDDLSQLTLIPNFTEKRTARSLIANKECQEVVNGGFYTKDNQPTGLFISDFKTLRNTIPNSLLNGYIVIDQNNTASIQTSPPEVSVRLALQAGPVLIRNEKVVTLAIRDDEFARRVGVGITNNGSVVFFVIYDPENIWMGPKLADVPKILSKILSQLAITDAVNLDGGSLTSANFSSQK